MKHFSRNLAILAMCFLASSFASAQWNNAAPRDGACFYTGYNFSGESFCVNSGQSVNSVPSNFNDRIRSIRVFGRARVQFYNGSNFSGPSASTSRDIGDLRMLRLATDNSRNWETRISSVQVSGGGFGGGRDDRGGYDRDHDRDRDHDKDRNSDRNYPGGWRGQRPVTVSCSSNGNPHKQWCSTPQGSLSSVRLMNQSGRNNCQLNQTFGIDNGRLWTSRGCSGTFEVR
jgi:Peptidase inhibitor family I36/Protein of unknown function (DUF3011)